MQQDRTRLEDIDRRGSAAINQCRNFRIGIGIDEATAELVAFADANQPGIVFGTGVAEREQLLEHDRDLDTVRRPKRIELHRMTADWQFLFMRRTRDRSIDIGETSAAGLVPGPDLRGRVGRISHVVKSPAVI